mgnify:CR=1 FL=1
MMLESMNRRSLLAGIGAAGVAAATPAFGAKRMPFFKRVKKPLGVQLYALGEAAQKDLAGTLKHHAFTCASRGARQRRDLEHERI